MNKRIIILTVLIFLSVEWLYAQSQSQSKQDSLFAVLETQTQPDTNRLNTLLALTAHYMDERDYDNYFEYAEKSLKLADQFGNFRKKPIAFYYLSNAAFIKTDYDAGLQYAVDGLKAVQSTNDKYWEMRLYNAAGSACFAVEKIPQALDYHYKGLKLAEELKDSTALGRQLHVIGSCFAILGKHVDALNYSLHALKIYRIKNIVSYIAPVCNEISQGYSTVKKIDSAILFNREALRETIKAGNKGPVWGLAFTYNSFGKNYVTAALIEKEKGNAEKMAAYFDSSLYYFSLSLKEWLQIDSLKKLPMAGPAALSVYLDISTTQLRKNNITECRNYFSIAKEMSASRKLKMQPTAYYWIQYKLDSLDGKIHSAFQNYQSYIVQRGLLFNSENSRLVEQYKNQNDFEKREKDMQLQIANEQLKSAESQKRKQQLLFAWVMAGLILSGSVYTFYRYRRFSKIKAEQKLLKERLAISQDLHDNVGSTLSSISVYSKVAQLQGEENKKEEMNELLGRIRTTSNTMITEMNDIVWAINPVNDTMEKIIQRMEAYAKPLLEARNIQFNFTYDKTLDDIKMEMEKRKNIYLIFKEAINNAAKYSAATEVKAAMRRQNGNISLEVNDNGIGFNVEQISTSSSLSGNGLLNMQQRAKTIGGQLKIESSPGNGTHIHFTSPV